MHIAIDCGPQVKPERVRSQMKGAVVMGMGDYEITRIDEAPKEIVVHLLPSKDWTEPLGGVGEPGVPPVAPAITNAIFAAQGRRIRELTVGDQLTVS